MGLDELLRLAQSGARGFTTGLLGAPVDIANMALGNVGGDKPVMGSEWIGDKLQGAGLLAPSTNKAAEFVGGLLGPGDIAAAAKGLLGGAKMAIVSPGMALRSNVPLSLPTAPEFERAVVGTPGAQITPDGLRMRVQRGQQPEQAQMESVRGGVFYLPEGAQQFKNYSTGKHGYGGTEKIVGDTLVRNPLFAKGGTGGKAPEAAYDSLKGKGAYQKMRTDALHWSGGPREIREEAVTKFLDQYAPDMSNLAGYILDNSKRGNQLPYALQEAAVAQAVRDAGHDAVLGYSKGKSGHFLSELFDVRESHYPDKFGWSRVFPEFDK